MITGLEKESQMKFHTVSNGLLKLNFMGNIPKSSADSVNSQ